MHLWWYGEILFNRLYTHETWLGIIIPLFSPNYEWTIPCFVANRIHSAAVLFLPSLFLLRARLASLATVTHQYNPWQQIGKDEGCSRGVHRTVASNVGWLCRYRVFLRRESRLLVLRSRFVPKRRRTCLLRFINSFRYSIVERLSCNYLPKIANYV